MVTLRCDETPQLKLGPGTAATWPGSQPYFNEHRQLVEGGPPRQAGDVIVFKPIAPDPRPGELAPGYATFREEDFPEWRAWLSHPGTPKVYIVDERTGQPIDETEAFQQALSTLPTQANPLAAVAPTAPPAAKAAPAKRPRSAAQIAATERMKAGAEARRKQGASA